MMEEIISILFYTFLGILPAIVKASKKKSTQKRWESAQDTVTETADVPVPEVRKPVNDWGTFMTEITRQNQYEAEYARLISEAKKNEDVVVETYMEEPHAEKQSSGKRRFNARDMFIYSEIMQPKYREY